MKINARFAVMAASVAVLMAAAPTAQAVTSPGDIHPLVQAAHSPDGIPGNGVGPEFHTSSMARSYSEKHLGVAPRGVNDFSCKPKYKDALPIILIPGTNEDAYATWAYYGPMLTKAGLCAYPFNYNPGPAIPGALVDPNKIDESFPFNGDIKASAQFLGVFVNYVMKRTGAKKVDFVGHSQGGGALPNAYIKWYGGNKTVRHTVGLVASNFGTNLSLGSIPVVDPTTGTMLAFIPNPLTLASSNYGSGKGLSDVIDTIPGGRDLMVKVMNAANMTSSEQQTKNSEFLKKYSSTPITMPGVKYTVITTRFDDVVTPYRNAFIFEPGVTNVVVQDYCANDHSDHFTFSYDPNALEIAVNALQGNANKPIKCRAKAFGI